MKEEIFKDIEFSNEEYSEEAEVVQLVGTKLGEEEYAIDVLKIQEIIRTVEITVVPRMDSFILGVMNLRGKVIPVIDLRIRFGLENHDFDKSTRIIVVRFEKQNIGFVVDEVTEVIRIKRNMVEPTPPLVGSIGQEYILGICKYEARLIMLLDIDRVISESGEQLESELRKKMLGPSKKASKLIQHAAPSVPTPAPIEEPRAAEPVTNMSVPNANAVPAPEIRTVASEPMKSEQIHENKSSDDAVTDSIDAQIARELAKREAETDEMNKKKRVSKSESDDLVLQDAIAQSDAIFAGHDNHVDQNDLDSLIAQELAKREAETDELNKKHKAEREGESNSSHGLPDFFAEVTKENEAPVKGVSATESESVKVSIKELKRIADKIISGEKPDEINVDIKGEIGELLRLIIDTKTKVDEINPVLEVSQNTIPNVTSTLEDVNHTTEKATLNLKEAADKMSDFYKDFIKDINALKGLSDKEHVNDFNSRYDNVNTKLSNAEKLGFRILEALEFQDITEQKLRKVIKSIEDMGARIGTIVGFLQVHNPKSNDKRVNNLLIDYGLS